MADSHTSLSLKLVYNSRILWIPIDSSAKVADLLAKWGLRTEQDCRKFSLFLADGELYEGDTLKELSIQQRETINVLPKSNFSAQLPLANKVPFFLSLLITFES